MVSELEMALRHWLSVNSSSYQRVDACSIGKSRNCFAFSDATDTTRIGATRNAMTALTMTVRGRRAITLPPPPGPGGW